MRTLTVVALTAGLAMLLCSPSIAIPRCEDCSCFNSCFTQCVLPSGGSGLCIDFLCQDYPQCQNRVQTAANAEENSDAEMLVHSMALNGAESACSAQGLGVRVTLNDDLQQPQEAAFAIRGR